LCDLYYPFIIPRYPIAWAGSALKSLTPDYFDRLVLRPEDGTTLQRLGECRGRQDLFRRQAPEVLRGLREAAVVESSESSNRIEGVFAPRPRIEALVLRSSAPRNRSEQEIAGYRDALNLIHESAKGTAFSVNVVLQLHAMLYRYHPADGGRWKPTQNEIVERNPDGTVRRVRFAPPGPVETPILMRGLVEAFALAVEDGREPALLVPLAILDFLCVHPFRDGNGRVGRLLTLQLLYHFDYEVGRYISLERVIEDSKETYYEALEASSQGWHSATHDPMPWVRYFWGVLLAAYGEFEERVGTLREGRGAKTDLVEEAVFRRVTPFSISDIEADCPGVSRDWIRLILRRLRDEGRIQSLGRGRSAQWMRTDA
jgi:Fic family protein